LPDATLKAFADHGVIARTIDAGLEQARINWTSLQSFGIDVDAIARTLENEGVASFIKSFDELLDALRDKASSIS
jgi:transaldolase